MHNLNKIAACLFLTLCAACVAPPKPQVKVVDSVTLNPGDSRKLDILANQSWRDTGINISPGETYQLTASGAWTNSALICGYSDADGIGANRFCRQDPLNLGVLGHALVGRIGENGKVFHVGKKLTLTAKTKGRLALWDYDDPRFIGDNAGKMTVTITRLGAPQAKQSAATDNQFSNEPLTLDFKQAAIQPHDVAVIIGNANYKRQGRDIPDVLPAYADAASFRKYAERQLGIKPGNIIALSDATKNQLERVFGTNRNHRGQLFDWVKSGKSKVYVYYAGHGAPAGKNGDAYLVPTDADAARLELNGYPLSTLYKNLAKLPATF